MKVLFLFVALLLVVIFAIKFAARLVGAKSGTGWILFTLLVQSALTEFSRQYLPSLPFQFAIAFAGGSLLYSLLLDTTFKKGMVISLLSSGLITIGFLILLGTAAVTSSSKAEQAPLAEMVARSKDSLARNPGYNKVVGDTLFGTGGGDAMVQCMGQASGPPPPFVAYLEILPDGSIGKSRYEPSTEVGECLRKETADRKVPAPPAPYVARMEMAFN